jgi:tetratricopeptide (TPR) repeat protein
MKWRHINMPIIGTNEKNGQVIPFMQDGGYFYKKGIEAYQKQSVDRAIQFFERAISIEPEEPVFICQLAIVLSEEGNYEASNDWLYKIKNEIDSSMSECYFFLANNLAHLGDFENAKINLETYLDIDEDGEFAEDAESLLEMINNQQDDSEESSEIVVDAEPENNINFSIIELLNCGEYERAEEEARQVIAANPNHWNVYVYLAEVLMNQGQLEDAKSMLKDLLLKEEPNLLASCQMTVLLHRQNDSQASDLIENLVNLRPMSDWDRYFVARSLYLVGEYRTSYAWYNKLLFKGNFMFEQFHIMHQRAMLAWHCGDVTVAKKIWAKIKKEDPDKQPLADERLNHIEMGISPSKDTEQFLYC